MGGRVRLGGVAALVAIGLAAFGVAGTWLLARPMGPSTSTSAPTSSTVSTEPGGGPTVSRNDIHYFRNTRSGLVDDAGRAFASTSSDNDPGGAVRLTNGDIYLVRDHRLMYLPVDGIELVNVEGPERVTGVARSADGALIWWDDSHDGVRLDGTPRQPADIVEDTITAVNGFTATVTPPVLDDREAGWVRSIRDPGRLLITDAAGRVVATFEVSGSSAAAVWLADFDGRRVLVGRAPLEPALGPAETLLIDLACGPVCLQTTFTFDLGPTVLNGGDVSRPPELTAERLFPCEALTIDVPTAPAGLSAHATASFNHLALGLVTCDPFAFHSVDGLVDWDAMADTLRQPPKINGGTATFSAPESGAGIVITIDAAGVYQIQAGN